MSIPASNQVFHVGDQSRREFLQNATAAGLALAVAGSPALAAAKKTDYTLRIAPTSLEIAPGKIIQTIGYNGTIPGPLIRLREGSAATIRVINDSTVPDLVHWHGLKIPSLVDGAMEEGTPMILPGQSASYTLNMPMPQEMRSGDMHPMHLHRHSFELVKFDGKPASGIIKDVVNVPAHKTVEVDFVADNPGLTLLHCHMQEHMDFGFMNLVKYI